MFSGFRKHLISEWANGSDAVSEWALIYAC